MGNIDGDGQLNTRYCHGHLRVEKSTRANRSKFFDPQKAMTVHVGKESVMVLSQEIGRKLVCLTSTT